MKNGYKIAALCTSKIHEESVVDFIGSFNSVLAANGWRVFIYTTDSDLYYMTRSDFGESSVFELIDYDTVDAVVIFRSSFYDDELCEDIISRTLDNGKLLVFADGRHENAVNIQFDYAGGFREIVKHVFDHHGVRCFHMIAGVKSMEASEERIGVVKELAAERNIPFDRSMISYGDFWSQPAECACEDLIKKGKLPEAVICANDTMAIAACGVFRKHGIRVPEDIIVTGFDGIREIKFTSPHISSVECSFRKMGEAAANAILEGKKGTHDIKILPDLTENESCGCTDVVKPDASSVISDLENSFHRFRNEERKLGAIGSKVQSCTKIDDVERALQDQVFYEMTCVLKKECVDPSCDPIVIATNNAFGNEMVVLFDSETSYIGKDRSMDISEIIPALDKKLALGVPLIFAALHFVDIPLGYNCFFFRNATTEDYYKIGQTTGSLSTSIAGCRNMRYQNCLLEKIEDMYKFDDLTGLYTRNGFHREFERMVKKGNYENMTFVLCDLDGLKHINDSYSHTEGDNAIKTVAEALKNACPGGICSKHGGDELIAVIPEKRDVKKIKYSIERYLDDYNAVSGKPYAISASVGVYTTSSKDESFSKMFAEADKRMYKEKTKKRLLR